MISEVKNFWLIICLLGTSLFLYDEYQKQIINQKPKPEPKKTKIVQEYIKLDTGGKWAIKTMPDGHDYCFYCSGHNMGMEHSPECKKCKVKP